MPHNLSVLLFFIISFIFRTTIFFNAALYAADIDNSVLKYFTKQLKTSRKIIKYDHLKDAHEQIQKVLDIKNLNVETYINALIKIFDVDEAKSLLSSTNKNIDYRATSWHLFQVSKQKENVRWQQTIYHASMIDWFASDLSLLIHAKKHYPLLPTGRYLLEFWSNCTAFEYLETQYIESFINNKLKNNDDFFNEEKELFETWKNEILSIDNLEYIIRSLYENLNKNKWEFYTLIRRMFYDQYHTHITHGLLELAEFYRIDFIETKNNYKLESEIESHQIIFLLLKMENYLYELLLREINLDNTESISIRTLNMFSLRKYHDTRLINERKKERQHIKIINDFSQRLASLKEEFKLKIGPDAFYPNIDYRTLSVDYTNKYTQLLIEIIVDFAKQFPLSKKNKTIEDSMAFVLIGSSFAHELLTPSSCLKMVILLDDLQVEYYMWLSDLFKVFKKIGFKLSKENSYPPIFSKDEKILKQGSFLAIASPAMLASYYELDFDNFSSLNDIFNKVTTEIKTTSELNYSTIKNICKNLMSSKNIYGNSNLLKKFNSLKNSQQETHKHRLLDNALKEYKKNYNKNRLNDCNNLTITDIKNIFFKPVKLALTISTLLQMRYPHLDEKKFNNIMEKLKEYISFLGAKLERLQNYEEPNNVDSILQIVDFDQTYFDEHIKPLYKSINDLLLSARLHYNLRANQSH